MTNNATNTENIELEKEVVKRLLVNDESYDEIHQDLKISRGKIYSIALKYGARKNESKIKQKENERKQNRQELLMEVMNATAKADVLDFLDGIPDNSVQMHLTSPPYNIGKSYAGKHDNARFHFYLGWMLQVLSEMNRTLKDNGVLFLQVGATKDDHGILYPLDSLFMEHLRAMGLTYQSRIVWEIPHGLTPNRRLAERYETCLVFSKGEPKVFNANAVRTPQKQPGKRAFKGPNKGQLSGHPLGAWPTNVWRITNVGHNHPERTGHPAQFPKELARRAILLYTNPGDLVCDVFAGSGTTQAAAIELGRNHTGADLSYEDLRTERLMKVCPDLVSDLKGISDESIAIWQAEAIPVKTNSNPITKKQNSQLVSEELINFSLF